MDWEHNQSPAGEIIAFGKRRDLSGGPMPLDDVSYLCITIGSFKDHLAPELAYLFRRMPNLSTLRMKCNPLPESHITEDHSGQGRCISCLDRVLVFILPKRRRRTADRFSDLPEGAAHYIL
ncbi:unnamed protein product [Prunus armeniaca]